MPSRIDFARVVSAEGEERERLLKQLVQDLSLDEKIDQMSACTSLLRHAVMVPRYNLWPYDSGANNSHGIPAVRFSDGPRGIVMNRSTCFPVSMARGATWDPALEERVGKVMGYEGRALGANLFGGVCINLLRHPGWGRAQESYGEDPYHLGEMGVALVRGVQRHMMACVKHFACNSIEESRFFVDVEIDERTLREVYLPHFKKCVDAGAASVMSAYNKVNGALCGHNLHLLRDILKGDWGFQGFVESDFLWGVKDTRAAAEAGLDIEMPIARFYGRRLKKMVLAGKVSMDKIDDAVLRIIRQKARFAKVGEPGYDRKKVACPEHVKLAHEVACKAVVLLKNENSVLPLERDRLKTLAVLGPLADKPALGDMGSSRVRPPYVITPLAGLKNRAGQLKLVYESGKDRNAAVAAAKSADAAVVVLGLSFKDEGEWIPFPIINKLGGDRLKLSLPPEQEELVEAVARVNPRCIAVLIGGSALILERWKDKVPAILMAWYPGMEGGNALADIIFGDVNPSGKLPIVFPKSEDQLPFFDNKVKKISYGYFHGYRLLDKNHQQPAFPFGFGLSYTTYKYSNLKLDRKQVGKSGKISVSVDVKNTGRMAGEEIVQLYIGCPGSKVERPKKELKGFARVPLLPGEAKTVTLEVKAGELAFYDPKNHCWEVEEGEYLVFVGPSSSEKDLLSDRFEIKV